MTIVIIRIMITLIIPIQAVRNSIKIIIIIKVRRVKNHRENKNGIKKRKKHWRINTPGKEIKKQIY